MVKRFVYAHITNEDKLNHKHIQLQSQDSEHARLAAENDASKLQASLSEVESQLQQVQNQLEAAKSDNNDADSHQLTDARAKLSESESHVLALREQLTAMEIELNKVREERSLLDSELVRLREHVASTEAELNTIRGVGASSEADMGILQEKALANEVEAEQLRLRVGELQALLESAEADKHSATEAKDQLAADLTAAENECERARSEKSRLEEQVQVLCDDRDKCAVRTEELLKENIQLAERVVVLSGGAQEMERVLSELRQSREEVHKIKHDAEKRYLVCQMCCCTCVQHISECMLKKCEGGYVGFATSRTLNTCKIQSCMCLFLQLRCLHIKGNFFVCTFIHVKSIAGLMQCAHMRYIDVHAYSLGLCACIHIPRC
jgi:chromosome segregation ATPase